MIMWDEIGESLEDYWFAFLGIALIIVGASEVSRDVKNLIGVFIVLLGVVILIKAWPSKPENKEDTKIERKPNIKCIEIDYQECSEDRRHFTILSWGIPATILLVSGTIINAAIKIEEPQLLRQLLILVAALFSLILAWNFKKITYYSSERLEILKRYDNLYGMARYNQKRMKKSPKWVQIRIGEVLMSYLLIAYTIGLFLVIFFINDVYPFEL